MGDDDDDDDDGEIGFGLIEAGPEENEREVNGGGFSFAGAEQNADESNGNSVNPKLWVILKNNLTLFTTANSK